MNRFGVATLLVVILPSSLLASPMTTLLVRGKIVSRTTGGASSQPFPDPAALAGVVKDVPFEATLTFDSSDTPSLSYPQWASYSLLNTRAQFNGFKIKVAGHEYRGVNNQALSMTIHNDVEVNYGLGHDTLFAVQNVGEKDGLRAILRLDDLTGTSVDDSSLPTNWVMKYLTPNWLTLTWGNYLSSVEVVGAVTSVEAFNDEVEPLPVPEPASLAVFAIVSLAIGARHLARRARVVGSAVPFQASLAGHRPK